MLTVMMRVFEGGEGSMRGGRLDRSRDSGDLLPEDARERCGEGMLACMFAIICVESVADILSVRLCFCVFVCLVSEWWGERGDRPSLVLYHHGSAGTVHCCSASMELGKCWQMLANAGPLERRPTARHARALAHYRPAFFAPPRTSHHFCAHCSVGS